MKPAEIDQLVFNSNVPRVKASVEYIAPELARKWLDTYNPRNRRLSEVRAERYSRDMVRNSWFVTSTGIGFDTKGNMVDGQHTCRAIVLSDKPQWCLVVRGIEPAAMQHIDRGRSRTLADIARIGGGPTGDANKDAIATFRAMFTCDNRFHKLSDGEHLELLAANMMAVNFAEGAFGGTHRNGITVAPVRAVVARAYYTGEFAKLKRFSQILITGIASRPDDVAAVTLMNSFLSDYRSKSSGLNSKVEQYRKTERALRGFLRGENLSKIYQTNRELFPLPGGCGVDEFYGNGEST